jgi:hypothetical protein
MAYHLLGPNETCDPSIEKGPANLIIADSKILHPAVLVAIKNAAFGLVTRQEG